jgi:hypothetical protein
MCQTHPGRTARWHSRVENIDRMIKRKLLVVVNWHTTFDDINERYPVIIVSDLEGSVISSARFLTHSCRRKWVHSQRPLL